MSSRTLLVGAVLTVCLALTGCTGRQILSMRTHPQQAPAAPAPGPAPAPGQPAPPPVAPAGPAVSATSDYPKDPNSPRPIPPAPFASMKNPLPPTPDNLAKGKTLFTSYCAVCHGPGGAGDGPTAAALNPKPADFRTPLHARLPDAYWFWRLSKGGSVPPFSSVGSAMPPWEGALTPDQRWMIILYEHTFSQTK